MKEPRLELTLPDDTVLSASALPAGPRRHVYHLQPALPSLLIRGLHHDAPDELLGRR